MMKLLKMTIITGLFISFIMFSSITSVFASTINSTDVQIFMDDIIQKKMEEMYIPNVTVSVVADGEVILEKGYGYANLDKQIEVDAETTLFRIGSTSKLFTWTAVMQLVEQGKLNLNADVNTYLDFEIPSQLEGTEGESESMPITLSHLLTHTPGFEDYSKTIFRLSATDMLPLHEYVRTELPARVFPAGEVAAYSNYGTALAGYIVEQVSGMPFSDYVEQNIFTPLGMKYSTFRQPLPEDLSPNIAHAYRYVDGEYREGSFEFMPEPAGGMSSTAADMAKFMMAHLQDGSLNGDRILAEETVRQMHSQQFTHHSSLDGMSFGFMERKTNERRVLFHSGSTMLFDTGLYLLPDENVGLFISYSGGNYLTQIEIFQAFMDRFFPVSNTITLSPLDGKMDRLPPEGTIERTVKFVGEYHQNRMSFTTSEKFVSLTMGIIGVDLDEEGYLLVTHLGETNRFVEVEPSVYHNLDQRQTKDPFGNFSTIAFGTDPLGRTMLMTDGPMTYSKAPWYSTSMFTFSILILAFMFIIASLVYWGIAAGVRLLRRRHRDQPKLVFAKWVAVFYGILSLGFVLGIMLTGEFDPVYGLPKAYFGVVSTWDTVIDLLPLLMAFVGVVLIIFTFFAWRKGYWLIGGRIHYTLFTVATMVLSWIFIYWNLL